MSSDSWHNQRTRTPESNKTSPPPNRNTNLTKNTPCRGPAHAHGHEPVEDLALLLLRSLGVLRLEPVRQPLPRGHVQSAFHKASIPAPGHAGRYFALTIYDEQTRISRSNITTNVGCGQASFYNRACNLHGKWVPSLRKGAGAWLLCLFGNALFRPRRWDLGEDSDGWA